MTPDELDPTPELLAAVHIERERVAGFIAELRDRHVRLSEELHGIAAQLDAALAREQQLLHVLGEQPPGDEEAPSPPTNERLARSATDEHVDDGALRGAAIREAAVAAALTDDDPGRARHYRTWLELVQRAGRHIEGRDPAATLLTQLSRCPLIVRAPEAGTYQLDPAALTRLDERRRALRGEADAQIADAAERDYDALDVAQALARIQANIQRTEKEVAEARDLVERLDAAWFFVGAGAVTGGRVAATG